VPRQVPLTFHERSVIAAIAEGKSNAEIARDLCLSVKTVEFYVTRLLRKLNARSRVELATWWTRSGMFYSHD
jgi:DNA-binding NarL/FixJ family response regulator